MLIFWFFGCYCVLFVVIIGMFTIVHFHLCVVVDVICMCGCCGCWCCCWIDCDFGRCCLCDRFCADCNNTVVNVVIYDCISNFGFMFHVVVVVLLSFVVVLCSCCGRVHVVIVVILVVFVFVSSCDPFISSSCLANL